MKCFYKPIKEDKIFYASNMLQRSSAYGEKVIDEFLEWQQFTDNKKALVNCRFKLCAYNDKGNNNSFGNNDVRYVYNCKNPDNTTPSLWLNGSEIEIDRTGYVYFEKNRISFLGEEIKGWGIICALHPLNVDYYLAAIVRNRNKCSLSIYAVKDIIVGIIQSVTDIDLPNSYGNSFMACFGCNIFIIHDEKMGYYHFVPEKSLLETVTVGNGEFNIADGAPVCEPIIATDGGDILWASENCVYGFRLGNPANLFKFGEKYGFDIETIQSYRNVVYIYYKKHEGTEKRCFAYPFYGPRRGAGELFNEQANFNLILRDDNTQLRYAKVNDRSVEIKIRYKERSGEFTERSFYIDKSSNKVSLADNELFVGSLQAGFVKKNKV